MSQKAADKFDGGATPSKGCFGKLEAKYGGACLTANDADALETTVEVYVDTVTCELDPGAGTRSCTDGAQNGDETDVDCGGSKCPVCGLGDQCSEPTDGRATTTCTGSSCVCDAWASADCNGASADGCEIINGERRAASRRAQQRVHGHPRHARMRRGGMQRRDMRRRLPQL